MQAFTFVHTADLHLDSPFIGLEQIDPEVAAVLKDATFRAFDNIIKLCIDSNARFLLVAGDVFDSGDRSLRAQLRFRDGLERLDEAGIDSFVVHGNHDPLDGWTASLAWPERTHIFQGDKVEVVPIIDGGENPMAHVYGISYPTRDVRRNLAAEFHRTEDGPYAIGLLHCNVGDNTGHEPYAPCSVEDLVRSGLDYWALGHVHTRRTLRPADPTIIYPGNPQGRNPRELGARGCYVIEVDESGHTQERFVEVDAVRWFEEELSIASLETDDQLIAEVENICTRIRTQSKGRPAVARVRITGRGPLYRTLKRPGFMPDLVQRRRETKGGGRQFAGNGRIEMEARTKIDQEEGRAGQDFVADFLQVVEGYRGDTDRLESLRPHLDPLIQSQRAGRLIEEPSVADLAAYLEQAQDICLDYLTDEGGA